MSVCEKWLFWKLQEINLNFKKMREIVHIQAGQCGNQIGAKVNILSPDVVII